MKKIVLAPRITESIAYLSEVTPSTPIFAKKDGKLVGMIVNEVGVNINGSWILRLGGSFGATGHHETREKLIESALPHGYEFFVED